MPTRTRTIAALLAAAAFAIPIGVSLGTAVPAIRRVSIGTDERSAGFPADLHGRWSVEEDGTFYLLRIGLRTSDPQRLLPHQEIGLEILSYDGTIDLQDAALAFDGTACAYRTASGFTLPSDGGLRLQRGAECADAAPAGAMMLTLRLRDAGRAALRTAVRPDAPAGAVVVSPFGFETPPGVLLARGTLGDPVDAPAASRLALLAYVWNLSASGTWIVGLLLVAAAAIAAAVMLASRPATAAFLAASALSVTYAILVPPFQAADEPNHFLSVAATLDRPDLAGEANAWARRSRFEEMRAAGRPFTAADRGSEGQPWIGVAAPDTMRGGGASALWWLLSPALAHASAPRVLLTVRLFHALLFGAAVGVFVLFVCRLTDARAPIVAALPIFLVPTLPYFGMHLSNYGPLVSLYVLFAAGAVVALWDRPGSYWSAPLIGLAITLGTAISRSALPLGGVAIGIAAARVLLGDPDGRRQHAVAYWALLIVTSVIGLSLMNLAYAEGPERALIRYDVAHGWLAWLLHHPWWLAMPGAALAGLEIAVTPLARRLSAPSVARGALVRAIAWTAAAAIGAWVVASPWMPHHYPTPLNASAPVTLTEYVRDFVPAMIAWTRFGRPDVLTSMTFWGGFGWLEKTLPAGLVSVLAGASGLALAGLFVWVGRRRSGRALVWLACAAGGYLISAVAYAYTARLIFTEVHGRYVLGLYLAALVVAWSWVARVSGPKTTAALAACSVALHAWTLSYLLSRYFF